MTRREEQSIIQILLTLPIVLTLSLIMLVVRGISNLFKTKGELNKLDYEAERDACEELTIVEETLEKKTNFDPLQLLNKGYEEVCEDLQNNRKSEKVHALMELRSHAFCYNFTFVGVVESTKFPKMNMEDFDGTGQLPSSFLVQKVDFGYNINKALSKVFELKLKKHMGMCRTYLVLEDGIVYNIEEKLSKLLMNEVRIKFVEKENLTNLEK